MSSVAQGLLLVGSVLTVGLTHSLLFSRPHQSDKTFSLSKEFKNQIIRPILKSHFQRDEFLGR